VVPEVEFPVNERWDEIGGVLISKDSHDPYTGIIRGKITHGLGVTYSGEYMNGIRQNNFTFISNHWKKPMVSRSEDDMSEIEGVLCVVVPSSESGREPQIYPYTGPVKSKNKSGRGYHEGTYFLGKKDGFWKWFIGDEEVGTGYYFDGKKNGKWRYYTEELEWLEECHYKDDLKDGEYSSEMGGFFESIEESGTYVKGKKHGWWYKSDWVKRIQESEYYDEGELISSETSPLN